MVSTCPSCKKQLEHEDYLFEVECNCGVRFNPFFDPNKEISETEDSFSAPEPEPSPPTDAVADNFDFSEPAPAPDFTESNAAFQDIVQFGEGLGDAENAPTPTPTPPAMPSDSAATPVAYNEVPARANRGPIPGECWITTAERLEGFAIEAYLAPLSAVTPLNTEDREPLKKGFESLRQQSLESGGNGVIGVKWGFTPDGTHVLMTGNSVRCRKE